MAVQVLIYDPANIYHQDQNPKRNGWHPLQGSSWDSLNGNISRVFFTKIPQSVPNSSCQQDSGYCCGAAAVSIATNRSTDADCHAYLEGNGYMTSAWGTEYSGIVKALARYGYGCEYDGVNYDGVMTGAIYNKIISHLQSGYKIIVCFHHQFSTFFTSGGHYCVIAGIKDDSSSASSTTTTSSLPVFAPSQVKYGSQGKDVFMLECILKSRGLYTGAIDGSFGNGVGNGVYMYQKYRNLTADKICGIQTWGDMLGSGNGKLQLETVKYGSKGLSVLLLQEVMKALGFYTGNLDRDAGNGTVAGIKKLQSWLGVNADGEAGAKTWTALLKKTKA